jgi:hypothetical protein
VGKLPTGPLKKSSSFKDGSVLSGIETDGTALGAFVGDGSFTGDLVGKGVGLFEGGMMGLFVGGCTTVERRNNYVRYFCTANITGSTILNEYETK